MSEAGFDAAAAGPPRLPFVLSVGITGHRIDALREVDLLKLHGQIRDALSLIAEAGAALEQAEADCFAPDPPLMRLISPIADGADQIAAEAALELGWELNAILPFDRNHYRETLADCEAREKFDELLAKSARILELPGTDARGVEGYVMTGRATVSHCDILIAVWDGLPPRGRGGTGEVVQTAIMRGTAVVHLPPDPSMLPRLLWAGYDPTVLTHGDEPTAERPIDRTNIDTLLRGLLIPPADPQERDFLEKFTHERLRPFRARFEYPLLLAAVGVRRFGTKDITAKQAAAYVDEEWRSFRRDCVVANQIDAPLDLLEEAYSWSDQLATHFAQTYRSGHVFNFVLGGLAVCMGLAANLLNRALFELALVEAVITGGIILNTRIGVKNEWHRRWLDYRQLAERLRPMRSLKLLGIAAPDPPGTANNPVPRRWIDWYATGVWRALGCAAGAIDGRRAADLARAVAAHEVAPQVAYHHRHSQQTELLDERLEKIAGLLFIMTLLVSLAVLVGLQFAPDWINAHDPWFTLFEAGLPAIGTAIFGIRFQGDFGGSALRSQATAASLHEIEAELREGTNLTRAADLTEQAARIMHSDLDEWRLVNQQQELDLA